jgi:signal transduction histidine kinase
LSKSLTNDSFATETLQKLLETELEKVSKLFILNTNVPDIAIQNLSVKTILVRIMQEFIQNTIKYANASQLYIWLTKEPEGIRFVLKDNGVGFNPARATGTGIGLENMKKRIALVGGTIQLESAINMGTQIEVFIPNQKL